MKTTLDLEDLIDECEDVKSELETAREHIQGGCIQVQDAVSHFERLIQSLPDELAGKRGQLQQTLDQLRDAELQIGSFENLLDDLSFPNLLQHEAETPGLHRREYHFSQMTYEDLRRVTNEELKQMTDQERRKHADSLAHASRLADMGYRTK